MCSEAKLQFPHCEFPLVKMDQVFALITERLSDREPASIIRLGDGEGMVLARPTPGNTTLWPTVCAHFGPGVTSEFIDTLASRLVCAIDSADVVGVRDDLLHADFSQTNFKLDAVEFTKRFQNTFNLRLPEKNIDYPAAVRLALMHQSLSQHMFRKSVVFCSAWLHFELSQNNKLTELIRGQDSIGLVSSKIELQAKLEDSLEVKVNFYRIPDIYHVTQASEGNQVADQLTDRLVRTLNSLTVQTQGQLFLIGAGVYGKAYCHRIKELGGIAIDIGAVCDAWLGIPSRPLVYQSLFDSSGDVVPENLLLEYQVENQ